MLREMWTTRDVAEAAADGGRPVTQEYIRQLCKRGEIPAIKPSRDWFIREEDARAWLDHWLGGGKGGRYEARPAVEAQPRPEGENGTDRSPESR